MTCKKVKIQSLNLPLCFTKDKPVLDITSPVRVDRFVTDEQAISTNEIIIAYCSKCKYSGKTLAMYMICINTIDINTLRAQ